MLRDAYRERSSGPRNVRLPSDRDIRIAGNTECATLFLSPTAVQANMQSDAAAFEAWALAFMEWCGVRRVAIDWGEPTDVANGHRQRFLYRLRHFEGLLGAEVLTIEKRDRLGRSRVRPDGTATLNVAGGTDTTGKPSSLGSEADLEKRLAGANPAERSPLMSALGLVTLDRQMPVGVFDGQPSRAGAIFTDGKSAIDLVGLDGEGGLWLLELKTATNIKVGALSELFFYSMVLLDACHGRLSFPNQTLGTTFNHFPRRHPRRIPRQRPPAG